MADKLADDIVDRLTRLSTERSGFEAKWNEVRDVAAPEAKAFTNMASLGLLKGIPRVPGGAARSKYIFDSTAVNAIDRLASGIEAIVTPQSEYWHGLDILDFTKEDTSILEKRWLERRRNLMFKIRYDADSGFVPAIQTVYRRTVGFGNSFLWVGEDEDFRTNAVIYYRNLPLAESFIATDHLDIVNTYFRYYSMTASQALGKFKDNAPAKIKTAAEGKDKDQTFAFIQCIQPRGDYGLPGYGMRKSPWASYHVFVDERQIISESGFWEFPVMDFRWLPEADMTYGEGPVMKCVADIQSLQQLSKNELMAGEQAVKPSLLMANAGVMNRPDARPGHITLGGISPTGQRMVEPLFNGQRLDFATKVLEAKRNQVKDGLFINLFQILVENPQMTATQALLRSNEKGELLGPAGARFQQTLSRMVQREQGILRRRGIDDPDSVFRPPPSVRKAMLGAQMTSPIDRLRRAKAGEGMLRLMEFASPLAQLDPTALDRIDPDASISELGDILGVPAKVLRTDEQVAQKRAQRQQQQAVMANAQVAEQFANAGKQGTAALASAKQAGAL